MDKRREKRVWEGLWVSEWVRRCYSDKNKRKGQV
jgi:hypothetical protein